MEIIPILERLLSYSDSKVLESTTRAISRIVEWAAKSLTDEFEDIIPKSLVQAVRNVSAPNSSCINSPLIMTILIKILACTAKASHKYAGLLVSEFDVFPHILHSLSGSDPKEGSIISSITNQSPDYIVGILALASNILPDLPNEGIWSLDLPLVEDCKTSDQSVLRLNAFDSSFFERYFCEIVPILIQVFGITVNAGIRRKCLECVAKAIWFTDKETMDKVDISFIGKFISDLIGLSQSFILSNESEKETTEIKTFVAAGLSITYVLLKRYDDHFRKLFKREGVVSQLKKLIDKLKNIPVEECKDNSVQEENTGRNVDEMIMNIVQDLNELEDQIATKDAENNPTEEEEGNLSPNNNSSGSRMAEMMNNMRSAFESIRRDDSSIRASSNRKNFRSISGGQYTSKQVIEWMISISEIIKCLFDAQLATNDDLALSLSKIDDAFLGKIPFMEELQHFAILLMGHESAAGLTGFEILENGIVESLWSFLTENDSLDVGVKPKYMDPLKVRIQHFLGVFLNTSSVSSNTRFVEGAFECLVKRLQECLSRCETFIIGSAVPRENVNSSVLSLIGNLTGMGSISGEINNPVMQLAKQIRIKLVSDDSEKNSNAIMVRIHAVASFKALEEYLKTRIIEDENFTTDNGEKDILEDLDGFEDEDDEDDVDPMDEDGVIFSI